MVCNVTLLLIFSKSVHIYFSIYVVWILKSSWKSGKLEAVWQGKLMLYLQILNGNFIPAVLDIPFNIIFSTFEYFSFFY